ncbi:hypothetical protein EJ03DRAFT_381427 [Teratosphaeria nubilosa]|uniref:F-box domain-containing protein n=1 Tax=Teratosphaeria nubilosa TaxID=161662 RepID=A0A6G1LE78_9PEZI|nr:hypothetical protein EJ03DRAFT_381427 [Teratosphaeria nubilosa]
MSHCGQVPTQIPTLPSANMALSERSLPLPSELVSMIAENMPFETLKNFRLVSRQAERDACKQVLDSVSGLKIDFMNTSETELALSDFDGLVVDVIFKKISKPISFEVTFMPDHRAMGRLSKVLERTASSSVSKLTVDFTSGLAAFASDLSVGGFANFVVGVIEKNHSQLKLQLFHTKPEAGRSEKAMRLHSCFLSAMRARIFKIANSLDSSRPRTCFNVHSLTLIGFSCNGLDLTWSLTDFKDGLQSLTLQSMSIKSHLASVLTGPGFPGMPAVKTFYLRNVSNLGATPDGTKKHFPLMIATSRIRSLKQD